MDNSYLFLIAGLLVVVLLFWKRFLIAKIGASKSLKGSLVPVKSVEKSPVEIEALFAFRVVRTQPT